MLACSLASVSMFAWLRARRLLRFNGDLRQINRLLHCMRIRECTVCVYKLLWASVLEANANDHIMMNWLHDFS